MAVTILRGEADAPLEPLRGVTVAVIGYGNQGHAHALNLRDAGVSVIVGARESSTGGKRAAHAGFEVCSIAHAASAAALIILALPDEVHAEVFDDLIKPNINENAILGFLHGFAIRYDLIRVPSNIGVILVAPKGPGAARGDRYERGQGLPSLFAIHQDNPAGTAEAIGLAWAAGIGSARSGIVRTTFADETETDLFGEQAVLCGGMTELILAAYETLVDAGYPPELAYLECCHEVKQIADLVYERGPAAMMEAISNTAEFGAHAAGPKLIDDNLRRHLTDILEQIRSGAFAQGMRQDYDNGFAWFNAQREALKKHPIDEAGGVIRGLMPWLNEPQSKESR